jgi:predicted metallopeptidase
VEFTDFDGCAKMKAGEQYETSEERGAMPVSLIHSPGERGIRQLPLVLHWKDPDRPLPQRVIRAARPRTLFPALLHSAPWRTTAAEQGFDFCRHVRYLCADIVTHCPELRHIDAQRLLFAVTQARNGHTHGLQARVTPLRFPGGKMTLWRRGFVYQVQRYLHGETEFLYLVTFCLPRFMDQDFDNKLITLFHELFHISPAFDGDLRRHQGRYALHTHSQREYDEHMAVLARAYLKQNPDPALYEFLHLDFVRLQERHGSVMGVIVPRPKIIPVGTHHGHRLGGEKEVG